MNISSDPTAQAVADRYCPHIDRLPKETSDQDDFQTVKSPPSLSVGNKFKQTYTSCVLTFTAKRFC